MALFSSHFSVTNISSKEVKASLDIKDVMSQTPCFSKTIAMNIALPSID